MNNKFFKKWAFFTENEKKLKNISFIKNNLVIINNIIF